MIDVVCAVIEDDQQRILACKRPIGKHLEGLWEFPGGKVESDESNEFALIREIREELELEIEIVAKMKPVTWDYPSVSIQLMPYRCRIVDGVMVTHAHDEVRWCQLGELGELEWPDADRPILEQLFKGGVARL